MNVSPTVVVLHEHVGMLELIEATLRDRGVRGRSARSMRSRRRRLFAA
jgi:hypothetical protein